MYNSDTQINELFLEIFKHAIEIEKQTFIKQLSLLGTTQECHELKNSYLARNSLTAITTRSLDGTQESFSELVKLLGKSEEV